MKFADPSFLYALALVLIPILIHFLRFKRYQTVYFSQVGFLKSLLQENKKKNNLKQLVILLSRCLAIAALVLAFARPYIPLNKTSEYTAGNVAAIYIDNSFSMNGQSEKGTLLDEAKLNAINLANSMPLGTRFTLLTNTPSPQNRILLSREQLLGAISKISVSPNPMSLSKVLRLTETNLEELSPKTSNKSYILSDFQKNFADFDELESSSSNVLYLMPFEHLTNDNLTIDSCWMDRPGRLASQPENLTVQISNHSAQNYNNVALRLSVNDSLKAIQTISIEAGKTIEAELTYNNLPQGIHYCQVELDDYPIVYDNSFYFSYSVQNQVKALAIGPEHEPALDWLQKLFATDEQVQLTTMYADRLQLSTLQNYSCVFLVGVQQLSNGFQKELVQFVANGGSLAVFPATAADLNSYNQFFQALDAPRFTQVDSTALKISTINQQHLLFRDVFNRPSSQPDLPFIRYSYRTQAPARSLSTAVLSNNDGSAALSEIPYQKGSLYQYNFPLNAESTNFYRHELFVPVIYNSALFSYSPQVLQYTIQPDQLIQLKLNQDVSPSASLSLQQHAANSAIQLAPNAIRNGMVRINPQNFIRQAGFYDLVHDAETIQALAFNYDRTESTAEYYSEDELESVIRDSKQLMVLFQANSNDWISQISNADVINLWRYFIGLALFFLVLELLVIRLWK